MAEVSGLVPTYGGQFCPVCNGPEMTLHMMRLARVKPNEKFECPLCGCTLRYTVIKNFPHEQMLLHIVSDVLKADGSIK